MLIKDAGRQSTGGKIFREGLLPRGRCPEKTVTNQMHIPLESSSSAPPPTDVPLTAAAGTNHLREAIRHNTHWPTSEGTGQAPRSRSLVLDPVWSLN